MGVGGEKYVSILSLFSLGEYENLATSFHSKDFLGLLKIICTWFIQYNPMMTNSINVFSENTNIKCYSYTFRWTNEACWNDNTGSGTGSDWDYLCAAAAVLTC